MNVQSDVSAQPMTSEETYTGALNRLRHAKQEHKDGDYYVSIESGIDTIEHSVVAFSWVVIENASDKRGFSRSSFYIIPLKIQDLIMNEKMELGHAADIVFNESNIKQKGGMVSMLTKNAITRASSLIEPITFSLIPFINEDLY